MGFSLLSAQAPESRSFFTVTNAGRVFDPKIFAKLGAPSLRRRTFSFGKHARITSQRSITHIVIKWKGGHTLTPTTEITIYFIALLITGGLVVIVHTMNRINDRFARRLELLRNQVHFLMIRAGYKSNVGELEGEVELTNPKTGEKLTTKAKLRLKE